MNFNSPYNTYIYEGLPPAPICSPGREALRAAAHPDAWFKYYVHAMSADKRHPEAYVALQEKAYLKRVEKGCAEFPPTPAHLLTIRKGGWTH